MRLTLTTVLVVTGLTLSAQNWCPPGATWTYDSHGFVMLQYGYTTLTYASDTLLGGFTGQVILGQTVGINSEQELDSIPNGAITRHEGHVVYTWSHFAQAWDTLYNFAAVPGEHWQPPFAQPNLCCCCI